MRSAQDWKDDPLFVKALNEYPRGLEGVIISCLNQGTTRSNAHNSMRFGRGRADNFCRITEVSKGKWYTWREKELKGYEAGRTWCGYDPYPAVQAAFELGFIAEAMRCKQALDELRRQIPQ